MSESKQIVRFGGDQQPKSVAGTALLSKLFDLLDIIGRDPGSVTIAELSEATNWPRATLYRILAAATAMGYVRQDRRGHSYALGFRFIELAQNVWSCTNIVTAGSGELRRLRDITGETAYLAIYHDTATLTVGRFESAHPHRSAGRLGVRRPLHASSQGKAILSHLPPSEVAALLAKLPLERYTPQTVTDPEKLIAQLAVDRQRGYSVDSEELVPGMRCVGVPILDASGRPIGAISVVGPTYRVGLEQTEWLGPEIMQAARDVEILLRSGVPRNTPDIDTASAHHGCSEPALFGLSPVTDTRTGAVLWLDTLSSKLNFTHRATSILRPESEITFECLLDAGDKLIAFGGTTVLTASEDGRQWLQNFQAPRPIAATCVHPNGTAYAAAFSKEACTTEVGPLDASFAVQPTWTLQGRISSIAWDPDGEKLYAAGPSRGTVYALAENANPRVFARVSKASGQPRGLATDREGRVWLALYDGWRLVRLNELGEFGEVLALPVPRPTGIAFGLEHPEVLHVTTAREGLAREVLENAPLSGRLLSVNSGMPGWVPPSARLRG